jgi:hypothetical protein
MLLLNYWFLFYLNSLFDIATRMVATTPKTDGIQKIEAMTPIRDSAQCFLLMAKIPLIIAIQPAIRNTVYNPPKARKKVLPGGNEKSPER